MAGFQIKKMNWTRTMSAYQSMTAWREKRKAAQEEFEFKMSAINSTLTAAWDDQSYAAGELAAKQAVKRLSEEAKVKQEKLAATRSTEDNEIPASKNSVFSSNSSTTLDGGSRIDLASNTLTLSNGTVIDLKTGIKRVNVTV